jgi:hypothetical protein
MIADEDVGTMGWALLCASAFHPRWANAFRPSLGKTGPHDGDVHLHRAPGPQHAGEHGDTLLGEGVGEGAASAMGTWDARLAFQVYLRILCYRNLRPQVWFRIFWGHKLWPQVGKLNVSELEHEVWRKASKIPLDGLVENLVGTP